MTEPWVKTYSGGKPNYTEPCERCGEVNPADIHTCTPKHPEPVGYFYQGRFSTEKNAPGIGVYGVPVYTTLPQREWMEQERAVGYREGHQAALKQRVWQGLTDEEIDDIWAKFNDGYGIIEETLWGYERAIETKLKQKNSTTMRNIQTSDKND